MLARTRRNSGPSMDRTKGLAFALFFSPFSLVATGSGSSMSAQSLRSTATGDSGTHLSIQQSAYRREPKTVRVGPRLPTVPQYFPHFLGSAWKHLINWSERRDLNSGPLAPHGIHGRNRVQRFATR